MGNGAIRPDDMLPFIPVGAAVGEEIGDGAWRPVCDALLVEDMEVSIKFKCGSGLAIKPLGTAWIPQLRSRGYCIVQSVNHGSAVFLVISPVSNQKTSRPVILRWGVSCRAGDWSGITAESGLDSASLKLARPAVRRIVRNRSSSTIFDRRGTPGREKLNGLSASSSAIVASPTGKTRMLLPRRVDVLTARRWKLTGPCLGRGGSGRELRPVAVLGW